MMDEKDIRAWLETEIKTVKDSKKKVTFDYVDAVAAMRVDILKRILRIKTPNPV